MSHVESFARVLNDYLTRSSVSESEFFLRIGVHPTTLAELMSGTDQCQPALLKTIVARFNLNREWSSRFYTALLAERDGEELLRAAGFIE